MIDLKELADVLNKHGVKCEYINRRGDEWVAFQRYQASFSIDMKRDDILNAPATTIIREALVRDGWQVQVMHDSYKGKMAIHNNSVSLFSQKSGLCPVSGYGESYTEALLSVVMEVWR